MSSEDNRHTGEAYTQAITARRSDRLARSAFHDWVVRIVEPGAAIFDFGAGTGIDAKLYAERGYRVLAYDADPHMCEAFRRYCRRAIELQQIRLLEGDYQSFLASATLPLGHEVDLVTANFAPFSLIDDLHELFGKLQTLTVPKGRVLASVLSPFFIGDMKYRWWWSNRLKFWRQGHFSVKGALWNIARRSPANFEALAAPYFKLESVGRGFPGSRARSRTDPLLALPAAMSPYMFLLFIKP
jgi:SAM-dependent methyltransferase